jgi:hypothetical protein
MDYYQSLSIIKLYVDNQPNIATDLLLDTITRLERQLIKRHPKLD